MCGKDILANHYPAEHCWICLRSLVEWEYARHYYYSKENRWEEAVELAGVAPSWLRPENKPPNWKSDEWVQKG